MPFCETPLLNCPVLCSMSGEGASLYSAFIALVRKFIKETKKKKNNFQPRSLLICGFILMKHLPRVERRTHFCETLSIGHFYGKRKRGDLVTSGKSRARSHPVPTPPLSKHRCKHLRFEGFLFAPMRGREEIPQSLSP